MDFLPQILCGIFKSTQINQLGITNTILYILVSPITFPITKNNKEINYLKGDDLCKNLFSDKADARWSVITMWA